MNEKTVQLSSEDFAQLEKVAISFSNNGKSETPPKFVIFTGGVGSGKTTIRKQDYFENYVNFEFGEILNAIKKEFGDDNPKLNAYISLTCDMILDESLGSKKNIVIEIIGDNYDVITPVIDKVKELGYEISIQAITCDPEEAYKRHLNAVKADPEYLSAHFTQEATMTFLYKKLGLGNLPQTNN